MKLTIRKKEDFTVSKWSGGTTTELYLYPSTGSYADRDFQIRVSSATVDLEQSAFTSLPGVRRFLTTLKGDMKLCHKGHYEREMKPFEVESFLGDWETTSEGKVVDFNLMLKGDADGEMRPHVLMPGESLFLDSEKEEIQWNRYFVYAAEGDVCVQNTCVQEGEGAVLELVSDGKNVGEKEERTRENQKEDNQRKENQSEISNRENAPARIILCPLLCR